MRIAIIGKSGQLAQSFLEFFETSDPLFLKSKGEVRCWGRDSFDLTQGPFTNHSLWDWRPSSVINASAYTAVDKCEWLPTDFGKESQLAFQVNSFGPAQLALECFLKKIPLIHFSTDYVFDGSHLGRSYLETDPTRPLGIYGKSKDLGEKLIQAINPDTYIFRVSWLYSNYGSNIFKTFLKLFQNKPMVEVVNDQTGSPTSTTFVVQKVGEILNRSFEHGTFDMTWLKPGIYHLACAGQATWFEFALQLWNLERHKSEVLTKEVVPILSDHYPFVAPRPCFTVLDTKKLQTQLGSPFVDWKEALAGVHSTLNFQVDQP
jgi:dTDP-4-dehydrorhamnose reductase